MAKVFPSLLSADFSNLAAEIGKVPNADALHLDIMDGQFVNNISFGIPIVESIRKITKLPLDTHLMIVNPEKYVEKFAEAGSNSISFHIEAAKNPKKLLAEIKSLGLRAGIAVDSPTDVKKVFPLLPFLDFVLIMTVKAGFGDQQFQESAPEKIEILKKEIERKHLQVEIAVDGGINTETAKKCLNAGADILIAGHYIFKAENPAKAISELKCIASR